MKSRPPVRDGKAIDFGTTCLSEDPAGRRKRHADGLSSTNAFVVEALCEGNLLGGLKAPSVLRHKEATFTDSQGTASHSPNERSSVPFLRGSSENK